MRRFFWALLRFMFPANTWGVEDGQGHISDQHLRNLGGSKEGGVH